ncbi:MULTISPECIES: COX15/CtaA family protein [unclassified Micromonospora]|uniref:COX15/CtaA family protein n=1 Tax=unclassified Micromonospora TaxID=2617518 RepID=UPI001B382224|nr:MULTISPECIES: COX15/CtaA family protein [unclassified Micromonospora]MBQ1043427.1 heme A synthase [Micromonospora sp. C72]MBQ1053664.1 heme A synthase [Micromonospora sp. C32]
MRRIRSVKRSVRFPVSSTLLRRLALASIIANVAIVVTGGAVRLTASGLGCPTWPRCTDDSYTTTAEMGVHGVIEFGNRLLTFAVGIIALAVVLAVLAHRPRRRGLLPLAVGVLFGIPAQAVVGGITVLTNLNPWVVGLHFLASMAVIAAAYALWRRIKEPDGPVTPTVPAPLRTLAWITTAVSASVLVVGTWVTGSGPHAGDHGAARNGLDPAAISQVHADGVFLLIGLSVALYFAFRAVGAARAARAAAVLIAVELGQGVIGFVQYFTHLPGVLVGAHMLGSCLVLLATLGVLHATRERLPAVPPAPAEPVAEPVGAGA